MRRSPWWPVLIATAIAALAVPWIVGVRGVSDGLTLNGEFTAMLPDRAPSVRDLEEIQSRVEAHPVMILRIESANDDSLHAFTRALAPRLAALGREGVVAVDWNIDEFVRFIETHRHLYADLGDLRRVRDALRARVEHERARANPFYLDLDDDPPPPLEAALAGIDRRVERQRAKADARFHEGFLQRAKEPVLLVVLHTNIRGGDARRADRLIAAVRREVDAVRRARGDHRTDVRLGGALVEVREEMESLVSAVRDATLLTVALVLLVIYVFFLRVRAMFILALSLLPPILATFAFAELTVDYLNASSAFLVAIVVGNGINPMIIWLARYFEARRAGEGVERALATTHRGTWKGTLTAALAAAVSYGSLLSTDYRGFRDFGLVGGVGMLLCWLATYLVLPSITVIFERVRPLRFTRMRGHKGFYGVMVARLAIGWPRGVIAIAAVLTVASAVLVVAAVIGDPMEYDFRRLQSVRDPNTDTQLVSRTTASLLDETFSGGALAVLAPDHASIPGFRAQLARYERAHPGSVGDIKSIEDLLPSDQPAKVRVLRELRSLLLAVRPHVDEERRAVIDAQLPAANVAAIGADDLPASVARPYTERDGTRGRILFVEHDLDYSSWDGRTIVRWARATRSLRSEDGAPPVAGMAVVFADVMETVWRDGPRAVGIAFLATLVFVALTFRENRYRVLTVAALLLGILWMLGLMALLGMRLNFLNMVAFPIAFGNNVDYAVNVMRRYADEVARTGDRAAAVRSAVEGTGGAVILCSLTTAIGYLSLHTSSSQALNSFGEATAISELTCLAAAVIVLPAILVAGRSLAPRRARKD